MYRIVLLSLVFAVGCGRPPDAPEELDSLSGYLFAHFDDEGDRALEAGVENLHLWLDANLPATLEGYAVHDLTDEAVDGLDTDLTTLEGIAGAAVGYESAHDLDAMVGPLVVEEQEVVFPDSYDSHERTFLTDPDCFLDHTCQQVRTENLVESSYALGLKVSTHGISEYRWVPHRDETALLHRTYLIEPADVNFDWIDVDAQYYVSATLPRDQGALRLSVTWIAARITGSEVPEGTALNLVINSMISDGENLDAYLDGDTE